MQTCSSSADLKSNDRSLLREKHVKKTRLMRRKTSPFTVLCCCVENYLLCSIRSICWKHDGERAIIKFFLTQCKPRIVWLQCKPVATSVALLLISDRIAAQSDFAAPMVNTCVIYNETLFKMHFGLLRPQVTTNVLKSTRSKSVTAQELKY